jgi:hypothetical protein
MGSSSPHITKIPYREQDIYIAYFVAGTKLNKVKQVSDCQQ